MKNKKGSGAIWLIGIALILILALGSFAVFGNTSATAVGKDNVNIGNCADSTGILTVTAYNKLNPSTAVSSPTITAGINGGVLATTVTSGTTTFPVGAEVEILVSKADYLDQSYKFVMPCGGKVLEAPMSYATSDNPSIRVKNDDGDYVTDAIAGGTVNQTVLSAGETLKMDIEFSGTSLESSGEGIYIIEFPASSSANITKVELSGATLVGKPTIHSTNNAGSYVVAFEVPAVEGSQKAVRTLTVTLGSTKTLAGGVYTDWYTKQEFVNTDGKIAYGVEDSEGTSKFENSLDFDFLINSA